MAITQCLECGGNVSTKAEACPHCGYRAEPQAALMVCQECGQAFEPSLSSCPACGCAVAIEQSGMVSERALVTEPDYPVDELPSRYPYFPVGRQKFIVMWLCTFSLYQLYWFYENWIRIKQRSGENIWPFWRSTLFAVLYCFSLFKRTREDALEQGVAVNWSAGTTTALFLILSFSQYLPNDIWLFIAMAAVFPLLPVLATTQAINAMRPSSEDDNSSFSSWNIAGIGIGVLIWFFAILDTLFPV